MQDKRNVKTSSSLRNILTLLLAFSLFTAAVSCCAAEELYAEQGPYPEAGAAETGSIFQAEGSEPEPDETGSIFHAEDLSNGEQPPAGDIGMIAPPSASSDGSFFSSAAPEVGTDDRLAALLNQLQDALSEKSGSWAVYIYDLKNDSEGNINEHQMQAASLIKLYIMGAVYENYDALISQYGQSSVDANLYSMITVSDNDAANTLVSYLGGGDSTSGMSIVNSFCEAHGYYNSSMGRLLLHSKETGDNYTSVADCGHFLKEIYDRNTDAFPYADAMFSLLAAQTRRNKIPAQMPAEVKVANKTGELDDVENDAGIIYDSGNDLIIVFMSENLSDVGAAQSTIASLSRQIYDYYNS